MERVTEGYKKFISECKTERECVESIISMAEAAGYKDVSICESLKPGDKVYVEKFSKAIALFEIGTEPIENGMNILGAHIDSPRLDIKQIPVFEKDFVVYMNTHYYGGIKKYQWLTMPLAIHGVVCLKNGSKVNIAVGESPEDPVFCISDILPHLAQKQMKENAAEFVPGESLDVIIGAGIPASRFAADDEKPAEKNAAKTTVLGLLKDKYGIEEADLTSAELEVVPAGPARDLGFDRSMVLGYGQDDRSCAYTSLLAMLDTKATGRTQCCICVDKEEIGSVGATGMASHFFENALAEVIARLGSYSELSLKRALANSKMLSSDVNAAFDPQNPDLYDRDNASFMAAGIVLNKYTGSRGKSGASDASPEFIAQLRAAFDKDGVRYQMAELGKVDQGGGGTIAYLAAKYGMFVIDAGVPVLSMHAPWEIVAKEDLRQAYKGYCSFLDII